jgi:hypothetical protein
MVGVALALVALIGLGRVIEWPSNTDHSTAAGQVLETRIVVDHLGESQYGGVIYYRIEAHVRYELHSQQRDQWMTASEATTEREVLAVRLSSHPKTCLVYWFPKHPENAQCQLQ